MTRVDHSHADSSGATREGEQHGRSSLAPDPGCAHGRRPGLRSRCNRVRNTSDETVGVRYRGVLQRASWQSVAPSSSVSFSFYYGAAPNEAAALDAFDDVDGTTFSLGQPSDGVGGVDEHGPTFIFLIDGTPVEV